MCININAYDISFINSNFVLFFKKMCDQKQFSYIRRIINVCTSFHFKSYFFVNTY